LLFLRCNVLLEHIFTSNWKLLIPTIMSKRSPLLTIPLILLLTIICMFFQWFSSIKSRSQDIHIILFWKFRQQRVGYDLVFLRKEVHLDTFLREKWWYDQICFHVPFTLPIVWLWTWSLLWNKKRMQVTCSTLLATYISV
jgi:hypothetical protein